MEPTEKKPAVKFNIIALGLALFACFIFFIDLKPGSPEVTYTAAVAILMALWWVTEALPVAITSLLPILLFPMLGVMDGKAVSETYINYVIFLFIGGFLMALALEKWNLHKRIALKILSMVGGSPFMIMLGFMLAGGFLSMWMSNTATAMMMLPIAFSVTNALEDIHGDKIQRYATGLLLAIAYACSIGGIATLVGTPPNLSFVRIFEIIFPSAPEIPFSKWMLFAFPLALCTWVFALFYLYFMYKPKGGVEKLPRSFFKDKYKTLGPVKPEEKKLLGVFGLLVFLWVFRKSIEVGFATIPGWSNIFGNPSYLNDGTVAVFVGVILFIIPSSQKNEGLLTWEIAPKIPWHIVLLFGGGFALAKGFIDSGLSSFIGGQLMAAKELSELPLIGTITFIMGALTNFTSNTATTEMMLPIISGLCMEIGVHPLLLMIPVTLAASMAFVFPVATPPNAIVFGSGKLRMIDMVKAGVWLNLVAVIFITLATYYWGTVVFDIVPGELPEWVKDAHLDAGH